MIPEHIQPRQTTDDNKKVMIVTHANTNRDHMFRLCEDA